MMKFKLVERGNPLKKEEPKKFYAQPVYADKVTQKQLAKQLADLSSLSAGDVANVIQNLVEEFPKILTRGGIVQLGDFGSFRRPTPDNRLSPILRKSAGSRRRRRRER